MNNYNVSFSSQVNLLVVLLGLWNGMVLLPVLLSLMGTPPYLSVQLNAIQNSSQAKLRISDSAADNPALDTKEDNFMVNRMFASQAQSLYRPSSFLRRQELVWNPTLADYEVFHPPRNPSQLPIYDTRLKPTIYAFRLKTIYYQPTQIDPNRHFYNPRNQSFKSFHSYEYIN